MQQILDSLNKFWDTFCSNLGLSIVESIAIFVLGLIVVKIVQIIVKKATLRSSKLDNSASTFITSVITVVLYIALAIAVISHLGFSTAGIIAAFSAVALAISLGLQNTLSSLTNGILIIFTKPFRQGDYIDVGGTSGTVKEIRLFNTCLLTPDNLTIIIPNSSILNNNLINYSAMPLRRIDIVVPVPYSVEIADVKTILNECISQNKNVVEIPAPFCRLTEYAASSLNFTVRCWTKNEVFWDTKFDLMESIFNALRKNKIEIPFDQLDVHVIDQGDLKVTLKETKMKASQPKSNDKEAL